MDRKNYDRKVLMVMDTIGAYLTYTVYNSLYSAARKSVDSGKDKTITDAYRKKLKTFIIGMSQSVTGYKEILKSFLAYYQRKIDATVTMREFEDNILSQFIPTDYYADFNSKQRDTTMRDIFIKSTESFFTVILKKHVSKIIDDHKNRENVTMLQEQILSILLSIRETYYDKFAGAINNKAGSKSVGVPHAIVEKLQSELLDARKSSIDLTAERDRAVNMLSQVVKTLNEQKYLITSRDERIASLEKQLRVVTQPTSLIDAAEPEPKPKTEPERKKMSVTLQHTDDPDDNLFEESNDEQTADASSWFE